jgi:hypothetical protein
MLFLVRDSSGGGSDHVKKSILSIRGGNKVDKMKGLEEEWLDINKKMAKSIGPM